MTGHVELVDELLEVQRLGAAGDVLGRHRGAADHEDVGPGVDDRLLELRGALRGQPRPRRSRPARRISSIRAADQLFLDRLGVDLLQPPVAASSSSSATSAAAAPDPRTGSTGPRGRARRDRRACRSGWRSAGETTLSIGQAISGRSKVGVDLPGDRHFFRVARPAPGDDADLVKRVRPAPALAAPDLRVCHCVPFGSLISGRCSSAPRRSSARRAGGSRSGRPG